MQKLPGDVRRCAGLQMDIDLSIAKTDFHDAYATRKNTIVLSKGVLKDFTLDELRGIMAHGMGHLRDLNTMMVSAYFMAGRLHYLLLRATRVLFNKKRFRRMFNVRERIVICVVLCIVAIFFFPKFIGPAVLTAVYLFAIRYIDHFFNWAWLVLSRYCEYRQDRFAYSLGYGQPLADALAKLAKTCPQEVSWFTITICSTHPVIYHRIRRLKILIGTDKNAAIKTGMIL